MLTSSSSMLSCTQQPDITVVENMIIKKRMYSSENANFFNQSDFIWVVGKADCVLLASTHFIDM